MPTIDPDLPLRQAAVAHARTLAQTYDDLVPLTRLRQGFEFAGERVSLGSFQEGFETSARCQPAAALPRRAEEHPDPARLGTRFERVVRGAAA